MPRTPSITDRGLGFDHRRLRKALLPSAYGQPCRYCGEVMVKGQPLDLDHHIPRVMGLPLASNGPRSIVHRHCNRRAGAIMGNRLKAAKRGQYRSRW